MPRVCTICTSPSVEAINSALVSGEPFRNIAERTGTSATALFRHKADHLPVTLVKAREATQVAHADDLLSQLQHLQETALGILKRA